MVIMCRKCHEPTELSDRMRTARQTRSTSYVVRSHPARGDEREMMMCEKPVTSSAAFPVLRTPNHPDGMPMLLSRWAEKVARQNEILLNCICRAVSDRGGAATMILPVEVEEAVCVWNVHGLLVWPNPINYLERL